MNEPSPPKERVLILAPQGRDALIAQRIVEEASTEAVVCRHLPQLVAELRAGADVAVLTEEAVFDESMRELVSWVETQPAWSDFPFVVLTRHGGGLEWNPTAADLTQAFGNVAFLERPFHPTTLVSVIKTALRGRRRQYECRRLSEDLEARVKERTEELGATNRELLSQIEEREKVETTLRQMQRLEAVGQLTSGVAHDFNNLLTVLLGNIALLEKSIEASKLDGKSIQRLHYMREAAQRGAKLTDQLLTFSRRQRLDPVATDLNETVVRLRELLQSTMGSRICIDSTLSSEDCTALVDHTQLELALLNLAINARDAMPDGGTLRVSTDNVEVNAPSAPEEPSAGHYVEICVADTGHGMPPEVRERVFEPFFTTKDVGKGSGLGLSQVLGFAKQSGGGLRVTTEPGKGTTIRLYLPLAPDKPDASESAGDELRLASSQATVLLVDDDTGVRDVTASFLRDLGYRVEEAASGSAALDLLGSAQRFDLLLVDFAMPGMNGADLARRARTQRPGIPVLFITGFAEIGAFADLKDMQIIRKPVAIEELARKVGATLAGEGSADSQAG